MTAFYSMLSEKEIIGNYLEIIGNYYNCIFVSLISEYYLCRLNLHIIFG